VNWKVKYIYNFNGEIKSLATLSENAILEVSLIGKVKRKIEE
jgi:hypothetical protein